MVGTEVGGLSEYDHVDIGGEEFFVGVESHEAVIFGDFELMGEILAVLGRLFEIAYESVDGFCEEVGEGDNLDVRRGGYAIHGVVSATAATSYYTDA